jgi:hypothetical protein
VTTHPRDTHLLAFARGLVNEAVGLIVDRLKLVPEGLRPWAIHALARVLVDLDALPTPDQCDPASLTRCIRETGRALTRELGEAKVSWQSDEPADGEGGAH